MADNSTPVAGGDTYATDDLATLNGAASSGVKVQRVKVLYGGDGDGNDVSLSRPMPTRDVEPSPVYRLVVPPQAVGANKVFADLFNASGSGKVIRVLSAFAFVNLDTAVTGTLGMRVSLTRTSAAGTGGTEATSDGTNPTAATISKLDTTIAALPAQITARAAPTGGATAGAVLATRHTFTEETNAGTAVSAALGLEFVRNEGAACVVRPGEGLRFVQGAVASVGSVAFEITFALD